MPITVDTYSLTPSVVPLPTAVPQDAISRAVFSVLGSAGPRQRMGERRQQQRHSYPYLVQMTPADDNGVALVDLSMVVVGKHLSEKGFDFFHEHPIAYKQVIISLEPNAGDPIPVLLELTWCRFTKKGWYDSGGRFLRVLEKS